MLENQLNVQLMAICGQSEALKAKRLNKQQRLVYKREKLCEQKEVWIKCKCIGNQKDIICKSICTTL